jgi:hypothetical protein
MAGIRNVISTLSPEGEEIMGPEVLMWHYPDNSIMTGTTSPAGATSTTTSIVVRV